MSLGDPGSRVKTPGIAVLIAMSAFGPAGMNIFVPSIPGLQAALDASNMAAQATLTVYLAALGIGQLFVGPMSDRYGRRPVAIGGIALFTLASAFCAIAPSIEMLLFGRVLQGLGGCAGIALARAIVRDLFARDKAASLIGYLTTAMVIAPMLAPAAGAYLDQWAGWRTSFQLMAVIGFCVFCFAWFQLHETHNDRAGAAHMAKVLSNLRTLLKVPAFLGYVMNSACGSGVYFGFLAGAPFVMANRFDLPPSSFGLYFIMISIGYMFGNFMSGRFAERAGANRMIILGTLLMLGGLALLVVLYFSSIEHPLIVFLPMFIVAISNGLNIPSATASAISVRPDIAGASAGVAGFLQFGWGMLMTFLVGLVPGETHLSMTIVMVSSGILAAVAMMVAIRESRRLNLD